MDLATLKKNLNVKYTRSAYATFDEFCADARLIFDNCKLYNQEIHNNNEVGWVKNASSKTIGRQRTSLTAKWTAH